MKIIVIEYASSVRFHSGMIVGISHRRGLGDESRSADLAGGAIHARGRALEDRVSGEGREETR